MYRKYLNITARRLHMYNTYLLTLPKYLIPELNAHPIPLQTLFNPPIDPMRHNIYGRHHHHHHHHHRPRRYLFYQIYSILTIRVSEYR